jgi:hypothetical protein
MDAARILDWAADLLQNSGCAGSAWSEAAAPPHLHCQAREMCRERREVSTEFLAEGSDNGRPSLPNDTGR